MNRHEADILTELMRLPFRSQRDLAQRTGRSLGLVNRTLRSLSEQGLLDGEARPTPSALELCRQSSPRNAIILAAGMGMRMAPINVVNPKALMEVHGETLIERQIRQLHQAGVRKITVVVGFLKERFDYLIDEYGVELAVNPDYVRRNNLASLALVADRLSNTYIVPCDIWCARNPFRALELGSWYLVSDATGTSEVRVNRSGELVYVPEETLGSPMVGIAYVHEHDAAELRERLRALAANPRYDGAFWEEALRSGDRMLLPARVESAADFVEVNTYEQLRDLDGGANRLSEAQLAEAARALGAQPSEVRDVRLLKKGLMNSTFSLVVRQRRYAMRIPADRAGGGRRWQGEQEAYRAIAPLKISEEPIALDAQTGHKLTSFIEDARPCDPTRAADIEACMATLRLLHEARLSVSQEFDPFAEVEAYEAMRAGEASIFRDYAQTKERVMALSSYAMRHASERCLVHVDPAPENFLFEGATEPPSAKPRLIDWEYAAMGDPHVDVALFCVYSLYDKEQADRVIDAYFAPQGGCDAATRAKIYCYIAAGGLMWSNWCEYKWHQGVEFGEYSLKLYRDAKEFARYASELIRETADGAGEPSDSDPSPSRQSTVASGRRAPQDQSLPACADEPRSREATCPRAASRRSQQATPAATASVQEQGVLA